MEKYVVISDPLRGEKFAVIGETHDGHLAFKTFNALAEVWMKENSSAKNLKSLNIPDGMHVSSPKMMTTSISILLENSSKLEVDEAIKLIDKKSDTISFERKINSTNNNTNLKNTEIRKIPLTSKLHAIDYKAGAFVYRAKKSSVISAVRAGSGKLNPKSSSFVSKENPLVESISKTAGDGLTRRVASSYFAKSYNNRLSRRSSSLLGMALDGDSRNEKNSLIDVAIHSKARRFL